MEKFIFIDFELGFVGYADNYIDSNQYLMLYTKCNITRTTSDITVTINDNNKVIAAGAYKIEGEQLSNTYYLENRGTTNEKFYEVNGEKAEELIKENSVFEKLGLVLK